jgi:hypothetical protein
LKLLGKSLDKSYLCPLLLLTSDAVDAVEASDPRTKAAAAATAAALSKPTEGDGGEEEDLG